MFRQKVKSIAELLPEFLRNQGLETPLLQRRLIDSWETVVGAPIAAYCGEKFIKNQTLFVKVMNPALRADLTDESLHPGSQIERAGGKHGDC